MAEQIADKGVVRGHMDAKAELKRVMTSGKIHHGWIFSGPRGIGKRMLAERFAAALLSENPGLLDRSGDDHISHLVETSSHPDLRVITRPIDDKGKQKAEIPVASARDLIHFFSLRPAMGGWRIAILDSLDELNRNGANALLKTLEEPPAKSLLILLSHGETPLLPTIKSRCRKLRLDLLSHSDSAEVLTAQGLPRAEAEDALSYAPGSPGRALALQSIEARAAARAAKLAAQRPDNIDERLLTDLLSTSSRSPDAFDAAFAALLQTVKAQAHQAENPVSAGVWADAYFALSSLSAETKGLNMDKSQAVATAIMRLQTAQRAV